MLKRVFICFILCFICKYIQADSMDLEGLVRQALKENRKELVLPEGRFFVKDSGKNKRYHTVIKNLRDFTINGKKTILVFNDPDKGGILFDSCRNLSVKGVTLDWDPLPFTQGKVIGIDKKSATLDIAVDKGYGTHVINARKNGASFYDPETRKIKVGTWDMWKFSLKVTGPGRLRMKVASGSLFNGAQVGDLIVITMRKNTGFRFDNCEKTNVEGVTIWSSPGIALLEASGEGGSRYSYRVTRGPAPEGGSARLLSASADAFNSADVRNGPLVENCVMEYQADDGVAIHGSYGLCSRTPEGKGLIVTVTKGIHYRAGDLLRVYDPENFCLKYSASIKSIRKLKKPAKKITEELVPILARYEQKINNKSHYIVELDKNFDVTTGDLVTNVNCMGSGFVVRNNKIADHRARGMLIKAENGIIENNRLDNITMSGICLGPEFSHWLEGDYVRNIQVRNNTLSNIGNGAKCLYNTKAIQVGAISVYAKTPNWKIPAGKGNRNIKISGNTIDKCGGVGILVLCAGDVVIEGNIVKNNAGFGDFRGGSRFGITSDAAIYADVCDNLLIKDNKLPDGKVVYGKKVQLSEN